MLGPLWKQEVAHRYAWPVVEAGLRPGSVCPPEKPTQGSNGQEPVPAPREAPALSAVQDLMGLASICLA